MNLDDFSYEENGRRYINPQVALDEENAFIQNLRDNQAADNAKIYQDTHNLGTDVPSNLGGLNGSESYFNARYQTPQTNQALANLKSAAQAKALTDALNSEVAKAKKRYQDAYYAAKSNANGSGGNSGGSGSDLDNKSTPDHENSADPASTNPNGVDTVEKRTNVVKNEEAMKNAANHYNEMVGGGSLPQGNRIKTAYLVAPNGTKYMLMTGKNIYGTIYKAPTGAGSSNVGALEFENQPAFNAHVRSYIDKGYKVQLANGRDITGTYNVYFAWFN